jgi:putative transposase
LRQPRIKAHERPLHETKKVHILSYDIRGKPYIGFSSFPEAKRTIEDWIREYNTERPHQELGYHSPVGFREKIAA